MNFFTGIICFAGGLISANYIKTNHYALGYLAMILVGIFIHTVMISGMVFWFGMGGLVHIIIDMLPVRRCLKCGKRIGMTRDFCTDCRNEEETT